MDHTGDSPQQPTQTQVFPEKAESYVTFSPVESFSLFHQGCDSKESKNQQLKLVVILYAALSQQLLSFITHDNFATKNSFMSFFYVFGFC